LCRRFGRCQLDAAPPRGGSLGLERGREALGAGLVERACGSFVEEGHGCEFVRSRIDEEFAPWANVRCPPCKIDAMREKKAVAAQPPHIGFAEPVAHAVDGDEQALASGDYREGELFASADFTDDDLSGCSFLECRFDSVTLTDAELRGSRFIESVFEAPFAHTLKAARTTWRDVRIERPRWGSAELFDAELESVHVRGGKIDYLNLRGSRLNNVIVEECTVTDLDLGGLTGSRVAFVNCRIGTLDVTGATCTNVDLRSSEFGGVQGLAGLKGMIIDNAQLSLLAPLLAGHLGLRVEN
jgi:uncharacterized protein YjbI with pentapeptide repeats